MPCLSSALLARPAGHSRRPPRHRLLVAAVFVLFVPLLVDFPCCQACSAERLVVTERYDIHIVRQVELANEALPYRPLRTLKATSGRAKNVRSVVGKDLGGHWAFKVSSSLEGPFRIHTMLGLAPCD